MTSRFWINPLGDKVLCHKHHYVEARCLLDPQGENDPLPANEANEELLLRGWIRCTISNQDLFYERRRPLTQSQRAELLNIGIEEHLTVTNDDGRVLTTI